MKARAQKKSTPTMTTRKDAMIRARTTPRLKKRAEKILDLLGLSPSEAINLFYVQVCLRHGLPFAVQVPNELTEETLRKSDSGEDLVHTKNANDLFTKLGI